MKVESEVTYWKNYLAELADSSVYTERICRNASDGVTGVSFLQLPQGGAGVADLTVEAGSFRLRVLAQHATALPTVLRSQNGGGQLQRIGRRRRLDGADAFTRRGARQGEGERLVLADARSRWGRLGVVMIMVGEMG